MVLTGESESCCKTSRATAHDENIKRAGFGTHFEYEVESGIMMKSLFPGNEEIVVGKWSGVSEGTKGK